MIKSKHAHRVLFAVEIILIVAACLIAFVPTSGPSSPVSR